jgi:hypothetical protein
MKNSLLYMLDQQSDNEILKRLIRVFEETLNLEEDAQQEYLAKELLKTLKERLDATIKS